MSLAPIQVVVRVRPSPPSPVKKPRKGKPRQKPVPPPQLIGIRNSEHAPDPSGSPTQPAPRCLVSVALPRTSESQGMTEKRYHVSRGFPPNSTQEQVFNGSSLPGLVDAAMAGYRATCFAYGQTGAGKTHTVLGLPNDEGLLPRTVRRVYALAMKRPDIKYTVRVSAVEVYNELCFDLLAAAPQGGAPRAPKVVRSHPSQGFYVDNLTGVRCPTLGTCLQAVRRATASRRVAAHLGNSRSSRSHLLVSLYVDGVSPSNLSPATFGRLALVDLAGSERVKETRSSDVRESGFINKSLYTLGKVISGIARNAGKSTAGVPYRDSALTKLLISSLGGNCLTCMFACVAGTPGALKESQRTLGFAMQVKGIVNRPAVHVDEREREVSTLRKEIEDLKNENGKLKKLVVEVAQEVKLYAAKGGAEHAGLISEFEDPDWIEGGVTGSAYDDEEGEGGPNPKQEARQQMSQTLPNIKATQASKSPGSLFGNSKPASMTGTLDSGFQLVTLQMKIVEARALATAGDRKAARKLEALEKEMEELEKEIQLVEQLEALGLGGGGGGGGAGGGGGGEEAAEADAEAEAEAGDGDGDEDGSAEDDEEEEAQAPVAAQGNPFDWNSDDADNNWQAMWENSLRVLSEADDGSTSTQGRKLFESPKRKKKKKKKALRKAARN